MKSMLSTIQHSTLLSFFMITNAQAGEPAFISCEATNVRQEQFTIVMGAPQSGKVEIGV